MCKAGHELHKSFIILTSELLHVVVHLEVTGRDGHGY